MDEAVASELSVVAAGTGRSDPDVLVQTDYGVIMHVNKRPRHNSKLHRICLRSAREIKCHFGTSLPLPVQMAARTTEPK